MNYHQVCDGLPFIYCVMEACAVCHQKESSLKINDLGIVKIIRYLQIDGNTFTFSKNQQY